MTVGELINHRRFEEAIEVIRLGLIENPNNQDLLIELIDLPYDEHLNNKNLASRLLETLAEFEEKNIINDSDIEWALVEGKTLLQNNAIHKHFEFELDNLSRFIEKYPNDQKAILHYIKRCTENDVFPNDLNPDHYISAQNKLDHKFLVRLYLSFSLNNICVESRKSANEKWEIAEKYINNAYLIDSTETCLILNNVLSPDQVDNWLLLLHDKSIDKLNDVLEKFGR